MPSFPSRGKNNASETSPPPLPSLLFSELQPFKLPFKLPRLLEKNALRLLRERERAAPAFRQQSATFTRDAMDVHATLPNAPLL
jgi:hypothetical protein